MEKCRAQEGREMGKGEINLGDRRKTIIVDFTLTLPVSVPEEWDSEMVDFYYGEGSWCANNIIEMLIEQEKKCGCLCSYCKVNVPG